ncbi:hypothetical protein GCM10010168_15130 [Actinoplanes ianthinogenes]|uniref:Helix-turn-helix domain-containing protein n=2 Tax=Actinoplanes ianthinogenes TaxID=122358 RepID=A0ABM7LZG4_9ACTN|nr:hypothetical protein Aiant_53570 [Actinoplanes ianthinogenes]GGQ99471.1 hypothetical protein GCM10010168_15130 [Actinoplanes ianthinogenes]
MTAPARDFTDHIPRIFTLDESAEILRVKKSWLERKAASREIPFSKLGGAYHFSTDHLWRIFFQYEQVPSTGESDEPAAIIPRRKRQRTAPADPRVVPLRPRTPRTSRQSQLAA